MARVGSVGAHEPTRTCEEAGGAQESGDNVRAFCEPKEGASGRRISANRHATELRDALRLKLFALVESRQRALAQAVSER